MVFDDVVMYEPAGDLTPHCIGVWLNIRLNYNRHAELQQTLQMIFNLATLTQPQVHCWETIFPHSQRCDNVSVLTAI